MGLSATLSRRDLLRSLLALPLAALVDVEQLIWTPGQQIVVPAGYGGRALSLADIDAVTAREVMRAVADSFFRTSPVLDYVRQRQLTYPGGVPLQASYMYDDDGEDEV